MLFVEINFRTKRHNTLSNYNQEKFNKETKTMSMPLLSFKTVTVKHHTLCVEHPNNLTS